MRTTAPKNVVIDHERTRTGVLRTGSGAPLPPPGTILSRPYKGETVRVTVLDDGFEHDGEVYRSLSAAARAITGSHVSGVRFFRLSGS